MEFCPLKSLSYVVYISGLMTSHILTVILCITFPISYDSDYGWTVHKTVKNPTMAVNEDVNEKAEKVMAEDTVPDICHEPEKD